VISTLLGASGPHKWRPAVHAEGKQRRTNPLGRLLPDNVISFEWLSFVSRSQHIDDDIHSLSITLHQATSYTRLVQQLEVFSRNVKLCIAVQCAALPTWNSLTYLLTYLPVLILATCTHIGAFTSNSNTNTNSVFYIFPHWASCRRHEVN